MRRIGAENAILFQITQLGALQDPLFRVYSQVSAEIRKIRAIQDLVDSRTWLKHK